MSAVVLGLAAAMPDEEVVERVRSGETALYEILMRRYNERVYRVVRGILASDDEAEDVMQEAYVKAYLHLDQFEGRARFSTWLIKIAVYEALMRVRRGSRYEPIDAVPEIGDRGSLDLVSSARDPEQQAADAELRRALEAAMDTLPENYRSVFVLREIEGLDTAETAECLGITGETVKIRLHRARAWLRNRLYSRVATARPYPFHLARCDRVVAGVLARIAAVG